MLVAVGDGVAVAVGVLVWVGTAVKVAVGGVVGVAGVVAVATAVLVGGEVGGIVGLAAMEAIVGNNAGCDAIRFSVALQLLTKKVKMIVIKNNRCGWATDCFELIFMNRYFSMMNQVNGV